MKIRIKGNSIRIRLSRTETQTLGEVGRIEECTRFVNGTFTYVLQVNEGISELDATIGNNAIVVSIPSRLAQNWHANDVVGYDHFVELSGGEKLYILVEKDFKCIDNGMGEDQSDNYDNPSQTC